MPLHPNTSNQQRCYITEDVVITSDGLVLITLSIKQPGKVKQRDTQSERTPHFLSLEQLRVIADLPKEDARRYS